MASGPGPGYGLPPPDTGAALSGWTYLVAWGGLEALDVPGARGIGVVIGAAVGFLVVVEVSRVGGEEGTPG